MFLLWIVCDVVFFVVFVFKVLWIVCMIFEYWWLSLFMWERFVDNVFAFLDERNVLICFFKLLLSGMGVDKVMRVLGSFILCKVMWVLLLVIVSVLVLFWINLFIILVYWFSVLASLSGMMFWKSFMLIGERCLVGGWIGFIMFVVVSVGKFLNFGMCFMYMYSLSRSIVLSSGAMISFINFFVCLSLVLFDMMCVFWIVCVSKFCVWCNFVIVGLMFVLLVFNTIFSASRNVFVSTYARLKFKYCVKFLFKYLINFFVFFNVFL